MLMTMTMMRKMRGKMDRVKNGGMRRGTDQMTDLEERRTKTKNRKRRRRRKTRKYQRNKKNKQRRPKKNSKTSDHPSFFIHLYRLF